MCCFHLNVLDGDGCEHGTDGSDQGKINALYLNLLFVVDVISPHLLSFLNNSKLFNYFPPILHRRVSSARSHFVCPLRAR